MADRPDILTAAADLLARKATLYSGICPAHKWRAVRQELDRSSCCWLAMPALNAAGGFMGWVVLADRPLDHLESAKSHGSAEELESPAGIIATFAFEAVARAAKCCPKWKRGA